MAANLVQKFSSSICKKCLQCSTVLVNRAFTSQSRRLHLNLRNIKQVKASSFVPTATILSQKRFQSTSAAIAENSDEIENKQDSKLLEKVKNAITNDLLFRRIFAIVYFGGRQHKITANDIIMVNKIPAQCGEKIKLQKILMLGGREFSLIGKPLLSTAKVHIEATVLEKTKGRKLIVFKKKRRKNWKKWQGHRQELTVLRINKIKIDPLILDCNDNNSNNNNIL
eukprot:gene12936-14266_t